MHTTSAFNIGSGIHMDVRVDAADSNGEISVFECTITGDAIVPLAHSHIDFDETVYGLEGVLRFVVDGERRYLGPGESFCIRRGQTHEFVNMGPGDARFLAVATPGLFGRQYFR